MRTIKGQAAVEYLMNYGWAVLILAIIIGVIFFTRVFNPNYFVMEECYAGPSFGCQSQLISGVTTKLAINISNRLSYPINLKSIKFTSENLGTVSNITDINLSSGNSTVLSVIFPKETKKSATKKISMNISYYICAEEVNPACKLNSDFLRSLSGRIVAQAN